MLLQFLRDPVNPSQKTKAVQRLLIDATLDRDAHR